MKINTLSKQLWIYIALIFTVIFTYAIGPQNILNFILNFAALTLSGIILSLIALCWAFNVLCTIIASVTLKKENFEKVFFLPFSKRPVPIQRFIFIITAAISVIILIYNSGANNIVWLNTLAIVHIICSVIAFARRIKYDYDDSKA